MKRQLFGWVPAALLLAAVVPGCSENNEAQVLGNQSTGASQQGGADAPPPARTQEDFGKRQMQRPQFGSGYPGASKNIAPPSAASK